MKKVFTQKSGRMVLGALVVIAAALVCSPVVYIYGKSRSSKPVVTVSESATIMDSEIPMSEIPKIDASAEVPESETGIVAAAKTEETAVSFDVVIEESAAVSDVITEDAVRETTGDATVSESKESVAAKDSMAAQADEVSGSQADPVEDYYRDNSQVVSIINASKSANVPTEKKVIELLKDRGFPTDSITYEYLLGGEYVGDTAITGNANAKRPMYQTGYYSAAGEIWTIFVINGTVIANPVSYNLQSDRPVQLLISESDELTSYDNTTDRFFVTIPYDSTVIVKKVKKIDAQTLDEITSGDIDGL